MVINLFGTRPEIIKFIPVIYELERKGIKYKNVFTKQHNELATDLLNEFNIRIDNELEIKNKKISLTNLYAKLLNGLEELNIKDIATAILVQGDTASAFAGALFAFLNKIPLIHIESGLRTKSISSPYPEEMNRRFIDQVTNIYLCTSNEAKINLKKEKITRNVYVSGGTNIDMIDICLKRTPKKEFSFPNMVLCTLHRRENADKFEEILKSISDISIKNKMNIIFPVHPNPIIKEKVSKILGNNKFIHLVEPLDVISLFHLLKKCKAVITDSGGLQEEVPNFKIPLFIMRDTTERNEVVLKKQGILVGSSGKNLEIAFRKYLSNWKPKAGNPYGSGKAAKKIVEIIERKIY